jgi:DNA polymerase III subunit gamma/tau
LLPAFHFISKAQFSGRKWLLPCAMTSVMSDQTQTQNYRVLARKYRPKTFADLIGQEALVRTLTNAFATGRIAQAYMLTGVRGVGKTTTARLIARALNYPTGPAIDMAEITAQCEAILESRHMDVIEMDAASNTGVDNMREIIESVRYAPVQVRTKVYIIDEVHMLSKNAFNALLKTLEEPPPHVKFIFATTEIRKVPVTILSRCQRFDLKRLDAGLLTEHYGKIAAREGAEADEEALRMIARAAEGSVRDGLSLLDQAIAYGDGKVKTGDVLTMLGVMDRARVIDLFEAVMTGDTQKALSEFAAQYDGGGDPQTILTDLADFTHWVTRNKIVPASAQQDGARTGHEKSRGAAFAATLSVPHLARAWQMLLKGIAETATAARPEQAAEMVLIRLCHASDLPMGDDLAKLVKAHQAAAPAATPIKREMQRPEFSGGPSAGPSAGPAVALQPAELPRGESAAPVPSMTRFEQIVALAGDKRDIKLKADLERFVRPISVADGKIELALEPGAPATLANELSRKLEAWTGRRFMILVSKSGGANTISSLKKEARQTADREVRELPDVQAILKTFPGAEIVKVRDPDTFTAIEPPTEDNDEESR